MKRFSAIVAAGTLGLALAALAPLGSAFAFGGAGGVGGGAGGFAPSVPGPGAGMPSSALPDTNMNPTQDLNQIPYQGGTRSKTHQQKSSSSDSSQNSNGSSQRSASGTQQSN
ncbi:MAG TPA: hypothetical protein VEJ86_06465 [Candidatus Binataceae bacterium]|nr:hypothetical protein [Candidatus Binataceae bacterium]